MKQIEVPEKKRVAIFTNFTSDDEAYSLNIVAKEQIKNLVIHGYEPVLIVADGFKPNEQEGNAYALPQVTIEHIPSVPCHNEVKKDESFDDDVNLLEDKLDKILDKVDVVITHDTVYQPACLKHNFAARRIAKKKEKIRWLHWIHSATSPYKLKSLLNIFTDDYINLVRDPFPNSYYVFFNDWSKERISTNFNVPTEMVKTVYHPTDFYGFAGVDTKALALMDQKKFHEAEAICVYPCRLDTGKQVEVAIKTLAKLKEFNITVRMLVVDFHSTGPEKNSYRDKLKDVALDYGLGPMELTFTSEFDDGWRLEVPRRIVSDFFKFSNVFFMPSVSESYSLVTQEALFYKCILVLNWDFPPFREIFGSHAIFRKYSSNVDIMNGLDGNTTTQYGPDDASEQERASFEKEYHKETAGMIANQLKNNMVIASHNNVRMNRNLRTVFKKQIEPLFYA